MPSPNSISPKLASAPMRLSSGPTRRLILKAAPLLAGLSVVGPLRAGQAALPALRVSDNGHYLTTGTQPFFWLGDTAWDISYKLSQSEALSYFKNRQSKGFNVALAVILDGNPRRMNLEGNAALNLRAADNNSTSPLPDPDSPNEAYFRHLDAVIQIANSRGIYMALVPIWGGNISLFDTASAYRYGQYLGRRYKQAGVVWLLGGDTNPPPNTLDRWKAMGAGLKSGSANTLATFHPSIGMSSTWFHNDEWLDFNSNQSGHSRVRPEETAIYALVERSYNRMPPKPVIDLESGYERIPNGLNSGRTNDSVVAEGDRLNAYDLRVRAYQTVFSGAFGYTYGAYDVISFRKPGDRPRWPPNQLWTEALELPGAKQVRFLRTLMESVPCEDRMPAQELVAGASGWKYMRIQATGDRSGRWYFVYSSSGTPFTVNMSLLAGPVATASWFDPRTGTSTPIGALQTDGTRSFAPPTSVQVPPGGVVKAAIEPGSDWVLKLIASNKPTTSLPAHK